MPLTSFNKKLRDVPMHHIKIEMKECSMNGARILVAEDNSINQKLILKLLEKAGCVIDVAENGKVAVDKVIANDFDLILMDLHMPEMDGYNATTHIRNLSAKKRNIPIIAVTAHAIQGEREKCLALGMNEYISKPFYTEELYSKMEQLLKGMV